MKIKKLLLGLGLAAVSASASANTYPTCQWFNNYWATLKPPLYGHYVPVSKVIKYPESSGIPDCIVTLNALRGGGGIEEMKMGADIRANANK